MTSYREQSTVVLKWNRKILCGNSCRRISLPLCLAGTAFPHLFLSNTPLPASNNFKTKVQLRPKLDAFSSTIILLSPTIFFNLPYSIFKIALPRYSRISYKKLNVWEFGHWLTANFTLPNIVWSFSMPLGCYKHLPRQSASIIIAFEFFGMFVSTRTPSVFLEGVKVVPIFEIIYLFNRPSSFFLWSDDFDNQQHFVLNSLWLIVCHWWAGFLQTNFVILTRQSWCAGAKRG